VFSLFRINARLEDRFRLLTGGSRVALPRQQTLRAAIDWGNDFGLLGGQRPCLALSEKLPPLDSEFCV
jgi:predicted ATPase